MSNSSFSNVSEVKGNLTETQKRRCVQTFEHFIGTPNTSFGAAIGQNLKMVEISVMESAAGDAGYEEWPSEAGFTWNEGEGSYKSFGRANGNAKETRSNLSAKDAIARTICEIDVTRSKWAFHDTARFSNLKP